MACCQAIEFAHFILYFYRQLASEGVTEANASSEPYPAAAKSSQKLFPESTEDTKAKQSERDGISCQPEDLQTEDTADRSQGAQLDSSRLKGHDLHQPSEPRPVAAKPPVAGADISPAQDGEAQTHERPQDRAMSGQLASEASQEGPRDTERTEQLTRGSNQGGADSSVDPDILASLPPDIQRELKLASMMKMGGQKGQQGMQAPAKRPATTARQPPVTAKRKKASIANYFSAK